MGIDRGRCESAWSVSKCHCRHDLRPKKMYGTQFPLQIHSIKLYMHLDDWPVIVSRSLSEALFFKCLNFGIAAGSRHSMAMPLAA